MSFMLTVAVAIRALLRNKMRASLTVLGIVIGISAVTTLVSIGSSAGQLLQDQIQSIGSNFIIVQPTFEKRRGVQTGSLPSLTDQDAIAIGRECESVLAYSPLVFGAKLRYKIISYIRDGSYKTIFSSDPCYSKI